MAIYRLTTIEKAENGNGVVCVVITPYPLPKTLVGYFYDKPVMARKIKKDFGSVHFGENYKNTRKLWGCLHIPFYVADAVFASESDAITFIKEINKEAKKC